MFRYFIINKTTSEIMQDVSWRDEVDIPSVFSTDTNEYGLLVAEDLIGTAHDFYNTLTSSVVIMDITDNEQKILEDTDQLINLQCQLSDFQEETWSVLGIDETKLSQPWQDLLAQKRALRAEMATLTVVNT